ncbi:MAG: hypothetical protein KIT79_01430 [Deltaproteobacteria bacterium]|nr:hypothetical protein [Deltaproteobacteria bacterium]
MKKSYHRLTEKDFRIHWSVVSWTLAALVAAGVFAACAVQDRRGFVDRFPDLRPLDLSRPLNIRVALAELPGLPVLSDRDVRRIFAILKETAKTYLEADIQFSEPDRVPMEIFFRRYIYADEFLKLQQETIIDPRKEGSVDALAVALRVNMQPADVSAMMEKVRAGADAAEIAAQCTNPDRCLKRINDFRKDKFDAEDKLRKALRSNVPPVDLPDLMKAVGDHPRLGLKSSECTNEDTCVRLVAQYHMDWVKKILDIRDVNGREVFARAYQYLQYEAWDWLARRQKDYELVIINVPVASAEMTATWPVSLRGGITTGVTSMSPGPLGGMVVMSIYPFVADNDVFNELRGSPPEATAIDDFAWYTTHELGHLIRRWDHPAGYPEGCVMTPATDIDYAKWVRALKANGKCEPAPPVLKRY